MKKFIIYFLVGFMAVACNQPQKGQENREKKTAKLMQNDQTNRTDTIPVMPVQHASFEMQLNGKTILVDPVGDPSEYKGLPPANLVLITHDHPDHLQPETLAALVSETTPILAPESVKEVLPEGLKKQTRVMHNGEDTALMGIVIEAIPMYNLRPEAKKFHPKGKGNGYVLSADGKQVYISGDTEDIPEMRHLKNIDVAFVCMNLPYTMSVDQAAEAVLAFQPKKVYPYHYRGKNGFSNVHQFKKEVEEQNSNIQVVLLNWYPDKQ